MKRVIPINSNTPKILIRARRDSKEAWDNVKQMTLQLGELATEIQEDGSCKYKIGDGQTSYCFLPYVNLGVDVTKFTLYDENKQIKAEIDLAYEKEKYIKTTNTLISEDYW